MFKERLVAFIPLSSRTFYNPLLGPGLRGSDLSLDFTRDRADDSCLREMGGKSRNGLAESRASPRFSQVQRISGTSQQLKNPWPVNR